MTNEQMRVEIAKAYGFKFRRSDDDYDILTPDGNLIASSTVSFEDIAGVLPNYPADLNAMHNAEQFIKRSDMSEYLHNLLLIYEREERKGLAIKGYSNWGMVTAPAEWRAEALLKTKGKWQP
jgi:hypothetical protein